MEEGIVQSIMAVAELSWSVLQQSVLFSLITLLLKVYSIVLIVDFILIVFNRDLATDIKKTRYGTVRPLISYAAVEKKWKNIFSKLDSGNSSHYKAAILEADAFIERMIGEMGYEGRNFMERCDAIPEGQIACISDIREAHEVRNSIIREPDFSLSRDEAEAVLIQYRKLLDELDLL